MKHVNVNSLDTCEAARWSAYVTPDMKLLPCSFDNQGERWAVDLRNYTIEEAWNSLEFTRFRGGFLISCPDCGLRKQCMGGCPICPEIVLCKDKMAARS
jgi:radical SAM protein with 4Fe4S-binding SPASM domain